MSDDTLSRIAEWCGAEKDLEIDERTITVEGDPPIEIGLDLSEDAIVLAHDYTAAHVPEGFAEHAAGLLGGRGSMLAGEVVTGTDATQVRLRYPIYLDGLNRQTFLLAVREITAAADNLERTVASAANATPTAARAPEAEPEPEPRSAAATTGETAVVAAAWAPTHTVPGGGMSAWSAPDPSQAPVATLAARVELRVDEQRGAWAKVTGSNGWTGWVDARKLRPLHDTAAAAAPAAYPAAAARAGGGGIALRPVALLGGLAMILGSFLSWVPPLGVNGWDVGAGWLWQGSLNHPRLGLVMVILGAVVIACALLPRVPAAALALVGVVGVIVMAVFALQVVRVLAGWQWEILWNGDLGFGMYVALVGSVLAAIPTQIKL